MIKSKFWAQTFILSMFGTFTTASIMVISFVMGMISLDKEGHK